MKLNSLYPVICTQNLEQLKEYYMTLFEFELTFDSDWYVSLKFKQEPRFELALLDPSLESLPEAFQKSVQGLLINMEVEDVDKEYKRLTSFRPDIVLDIRTEEWGQRHFIIKDPAGVLIDVIQNIEPGDEYKDQYQ